MSELDEGRWSVLHLPMLLSHGKGVGKLSTANIVSINPIMAGLVPVAVEVTFSVNHGKGQLTYLYSAIEAVRGILAGDDPSQWSGERVDSSGGSAGSASGIGVDIGEIADIAEIGEAAL
jgi:hypothetical protein